MVVLGLETSTCSLCGDTGMDRSRAGNSPIPDFQILSISWCLLFFKSLPLELVRVMAK